jgi:hypothetical protein
MAEVPIAGASGRPGTGVLARLEAVDHQRVDLVVCSLSKHVLAAPLHAACFADAVSYDLVFWKQQEGVNLDPAVVDRALRDAVRPAELVEPAGLVELPIEAWLDELMRSFPDAVRGPNGPNEWIDWVSSDGRRSFQVEWSAVHVEIACRGTDNATMNRIIDIALEFGCPLYDPQTGERFDSSTTH